MFACCLYSWHFYFVLWIYSSQLKQYIELFCDKMMWVLFGIIRAILGDYMGLLTWFAGSVAKFSRFAGIYSMKTDVCPFSNRQIFNWQQVNSYYVKLDLHHWLHCIFLADLSSLPKLKKWLCVEASLRSNYFPPKAWSDAYGKGFLVGISDKIGSLPWSFTRS